MKQNLFRCQHADRKGVICGEAAQWKLYAGLSMKFVGYCCAPHLGSEMVKHRRPTYTVSRAIPYKKQKEV